MKIIIIKDYHFSFRFTLEKPRCIKVKQKTHMERKMIIELLFIGAKNIFKNFKNGVM